MSELTGRFAWFDLMTSDVAKAKAFYTALVGWKVADWNQGQYEMWQAGEKTVGGVMGLPPDAAKAGQPPSWLGYVVTPDADRAVERAKELGGKVVVPGTDIPEVGRYAVLADPQGAVFAVFQSKPMEGGGGGAPDPMAPGHFAWSELNTTDWKSAWTFYSGLFGWKKTQSMDMGPELGEYFMFGADEKNTMGGMFNGATAAKVPPNWLHYIRVTDVDAAAKRIPELGGKILNGPMEVPGGDRIVQCMDPQGGAFALVSAPAKAG